MSFGYQMLGFGGGGTPATPIDTLLATALARYTADDIVGSNPVTEWTNSGTGGTGYDLDTVVGTAANLVKLPSNMVRRSASASELITTPDQAALDITDDVTLIAYVAMDDWTSTGYFLVKYGDAGAGANMSYGFRSWTGDKLHFVTTTTGMTSAQTQSLSSVTHGFTDGTAHWVRATFDQSANTVNFYTSEDASTTDPLAVSWSLLGDADVAHSTGSIYSGNAGIGIGASTSGNGPSAGYFGRAVIIASTDPTASPAIDFNPADASPNADTWTSSGAGGEVWTIEGDAVVNATDYDAVYVKGSVGIETTTGQDIDWPVTVFTVFKPALAAPSDSNLYDSKSVFDGRLAVIYGQAAASDRYYGYAGGASLELSEPYTTDLQISTLQYNDDATSKLTISGVGSVTGDFGTSSNWDFGTAFIDYDTLNGVVGAAYEYIVFDSALSEDNVALVQDYLETKYELANAETLLATALVHYTPADIVGTFPVTEWTNSGTGGTDYDLDTVVGTAANLISLPSKAARLTGTSGDSFSTPDSAGNSPSGSLEIVARISADDWTKSGDDVISAKWNTSNLAWFFSVQGTSGELHLYISDGGGVGDSANSSVGVGFTDGATHWVRVTFDDTLDDVNFYTADDSETIPVSWTQLGTADLTLTSTGIYNSNAAVEIGSSDGGNSNNFAGVIHRVVHYDGIGGTVFNDFNAADATANDSTWTSSGAGGETWTINGDAFVNTTDYAAVFSKGSVLIETTDLQIHAAPLTTFIVLKPTLSAPGADAYFYDAGTGATDRNLLFTDDSNSDKYTLYAGSFLALSDAYSNDATIISIQHNGDATTKLTVANTGGVTGDAGALDQEMLTLFDKLGGGESWQGAMYEVILFNSALTDSEAGTIRNHLLTKYGL